MDYIFFGRDAGAQVLSCVPGGKLRRRSISPICMKHNAMTNMPEVKGGIAQPSLGMQRYLVAATTLLGLARPQRDTLTVMSVVKLKSFLKCAP